MIAPTRAAPDPVSDVDVDDVLFRHLVETVRDYAIFVLTADGRVASWNAGAERLKGYSREQILGRHFSIFYPQDAVEAGWPPEELRRAAELGRFEDEGWRLRRDGTRFWANVVITALYAADGSVRGFAKITRDLTERREHEGRLRESERSLRMLIDGVEDYAIFMLDPTGVITSWNRGAQRIKGYAPEEAIGRHFSMFYTPQALAVGWPAEELRRARQHGRFEDEGWRVRKDGSLFWANVVITAMLDEQGRVHGYSKITRDLTERKRHEQRLQDSEENLRRLIEGVQDHAIFHVDARGRIGSWNAGAERLFGYGADAAVGLDRAAFYSEADRNADRPRQDLVAAGRTGSDRSAGWRVRADGSPLWADVALSALADDQGRPLGFVEIVRDLTEQRRVEELELRSRRVHEFIAMLSHELRNPLAPIRNAVNVLRLTEHAPESGRMVELIGRQVDHLSRLVDDLLDVSRISTGKFRLELQPIDLRAVVAAGIESLRSSLDANGHTIVSGLCEQPVVVSGDATRLTQVVVNLLGNANKYTPPGGRIEVALASDGCEARLTVADSGIGMAPALAEQAFEPFVQGHPDAGRSEGGLGIGLWLVKGIVELHGGSVWVRSAPGAGSTFGVALPLTAAAAAAAEPPAPAGARRRRRVLVVDDNRDSADSLAMYLELLGHDVDVANDGEAAVRLAAERAPALVLLDLGLPGIDGYEVARRLRALPGLGDARLIALTGYGQESDRRRTAAAGFAHHLVKPVDLDALAALVGG